MKTKIRDLFVFVDERQRPVDITALQERGVAEQSVRADPPSTSEFTEPWPEFEDDAEESRPSVWDVLTRPGVFTALIAAVAVPVAIALVLILSSSDTGSPPRAEGGSEPTAGPASAGDTPVAAQPPVPVATPAPAVSSLTWSRVPDDEAVFGGEGEQVMMGVSVGGPGLVAVGEDSRNAAVWASVDGIAWSRVPHDEAVFGGVGDQGMFDVTVGGPGLVAVGSDERDDGAAVWTSVDGLSWSRVPRSRRSSDPSSVWVRKMVSVTAGGLGLVAVGPAGVNDAVRTSVDGLTWSGDGWFEGNMLSVTAGGPGLVVVGSSGLDAAVWTSVDGVAWSRVLHDDAVFGGDGFQEMASVTAGGPGLVAVGVDGPNAAAWTSVDGVYLVSRSPRRGGLRRRGFPGDGERERDRWRHGLGGGRIGRRDRGSLGVR